MSKAKKILSLLSKGKSIEEAYVYYVRWTDKKGKAAPKKKKSKIVKAVKEVKQALDAIESKPTKLLVRPEHKDAALKLLNMKEADPVNHPPHYKTGGIETIDFIEAKDLNYRLGNVIKAVPVRKKPTLCKTLRKQCSISSARLTLGNLRET
jgi:hypothetical protein